MTASAPIDPRPPSSGPWIASTAASRVSASSASPGTSTGRRATDRCSARGAGSERMPVPGGASRPTVTNATTATGTTNRKSERQPSPLTMIPPMSGPIAALIEVRLSNMPKAAPRRCGGASAATRAVELVATNAPLTAWRTRATARTKKVGANAARIDAAPKPTTPTRKERRWPTRSPIVPLTGSTIATAARYSATRDATAAGSTPKVSITLGSATANIVELSGTRTAPKTMPSIAAVRRRSRGSMSVTGSERTQSRRRAPRSTRPGPVSLRHRARPRPGARTPARRRRRGS